jgi:hypothetical protein
MSMGIRADSAHHALLHGIWHDARLPLEGNYVESWRRHNPGAAIKVWTLDEGRELIARHVPELLGHWDAFPFLIQKVNVLRMVILHAAGGVYLDLDMECLRPLASFFGRDIFFGRHDIAGVCNAILGSRPGHPFWRAALDHVLAGEPVIPVSSDGINSTGSGLIVKLIESSGLWDKCEPSRVFFPAAGCETGSYTAHRGRTPRWLGRQFDQEGNLLNNAPWLLKRAA